MASGKRRYLVGVPMYDERGVARLVVDDLLGELAALPVDWTVLVVDDGSSDGTSEILAGIPGIHVLRHPENRGVGAAFASMLDYCRKGDFTHFVFQEGSSKVRAREIAKLIRVAEEGDWDYILGSRFLEGVHNTPWGRRLLIRSFSALFHLVTGFPVTDISCGPRVLALSVWDHRLDRMSRYFGYQFEQLMTIHVLDRGARFRAAPVEIQYNELRPYSYVKLYNMSQVIRPWIHYILWKRLLPIRALRPEWLALQAAIAGRPGTGSAR